MVRFLCRLKLFTTVYIFFSALYGLWLSFRCEIEDKAKQLHDFSLCGFLDAPDDGYTA